MKQLYYNVRIFKTFYKIHSMTLKLINVYLKMLLYITSIKWSLASVTDTDCITFMISLHTQLHKCQVL